MNLGVLKNSTAYDKIIIVNVSGRGDKDVAAIADYLEKRNMKNQE